MKYETDYMVQNYGVWRIDRHKEKEITANEAQEIASALREVGARESRSEFYNCTRFKVVTGATITRYIQLTSNKLTCAIGYTGRKGAIHENTITRYTFSNCSSCCAVHRFLGIQHKTS